MPERIEAVTPDLTQENVEKILALFPNVGTEVQDKETGEIKCAIDFDALRDQLGDVAEGMRERYQFTWPGKRAAKEEARRPIAKTLRPVKERSKNWDDTQNLYIEGDNLDALKILRETYAGKIKMIYIDPPYNTGHDFVYHDHFAQKDNDYKPNNGEHTEEGQLVANPESNGRFHSDWCSMMYPRLLLARDLLSSDGAIFVSLDDNEITNATKIMDEIYGEKNRVAIICHKSRASISNDKVISPNHNLILFYVKNVDLVEKTKSKIGLDPDLTGFDNDDQDNRGPYKLVPVDGPGGARKGNPYYSFLGVEGYWRFSKQTMQEKYQNGLIVKRGDSLAQKYYLAQAKESRKTATTWWDDAGLTSTATANLKTLMGGKTFDAPKPVSLIYRMLQLISYLDKDSIILDFFSGSATTAHAVMQLNAEDGGHRKFIMVQLPEVCDEKSEAAKAGYHTICEIGEERIRRAGEKIKAEVENQQLALGGGDLKQVPDIGFRVLRVDSSNYQDARRTPEETVQGSLDDLIDVAKSDRESLDKLFECFPTFQLPYDSSIEVLDGPAFAGHTVYSVNGGQLVACFDTGIPESVLRGMAALDPKPSYAVAAESGLKNSKTVTNFAEIFKQTANAQQGSTQIRII